MFLFSWFLASLLENVADLQCYQIAQPSAVSYTHLPVRLCSSDAPNALQLGMSINGFLLPPPPKIGVILRAPTAHPRASLPAAQLYTVSMASILTATSAYLFPSPSMAVRTGNGNGQCHHTTSWLPSTGPEHTRPEGQHHLAPPISFHHLSSHFGLPGPHSALSGRLNSAISFAWAPHHSSLHILFIL